MKKLIEKTLFLLALAFLIIGVLDLLGMKRDVSPLFIEFSSHDNSIISDDGPIYKERVF